MLLAEHEHVVCELEQLKRDNEAVKLRQRSLIGAKEKLIAKLKLDVADREQKLTNLLSANDHLYAVCLSNGISIEDLGIASHTVESSTVDLQAQPSRLPGYQYNRPNDVIIIEDPKSPGSGQRKTAEISYQHMGHLFTTASVRFRIYMLTSH